MLPQSGGGFAFFSDRKNNETEAKSSLVQMHSIDDTAELPDIKKFIYDNGFTVEQDITYIHTDKRIF